MTTSDGNRQILITRSASPNHGGYVSEIVTGESWEYKANSLIIYGQVDGERAEVARYRDGFWYGVRFRDMALQPLESTSTFPPRGFHFGKSDADYHDYDDMPVGGGEAHEAPETSDSGSRDGSPGDRGDSSGSSGEPSVILSASGGVSKPDLS